MPSDFSSKGRTSTYYVTVFQGLLLGFLCLVLLMALSRSTCKRGTCSCYPSCRSSKRDGIAERRKLGIREELHALRTDRQPTFLAQRLALQVLLTTAVILYTGGKHEA